MKYHFFNDYSEGAHPKIIDLLLKTNLQQEIGYGEDRISAEAAALLKDAIQNQAADIHFVSGGTQANLVVLSSILKPYESVISSNRGHISIHEAGAIEATGHKINVVQTDDGKLTAEKIQAVVDDHTDEHMVRPGAVFISNSTEVGTVYKKHELESIAQVCRQNRLYLYLDGARLGMALCSRESDLTLPELSGLVDIYYIGGTKNGALIGEAIVINNPDLKHKFRFHLKQKGALLAKGRLIGVQFLGLFSNGLYFELARHANAMAERLSCGIHSQGFGFLSQSSTNLIFPIFPNALIEQLQEWYGFYVWSKVEPGHSAARLVTSWATPVEKVNEFVDDLQRLKEG